MFLGVIRFSTTDPAFAFGNIFFHLAINREKDFCSKLDCIGVTWNSEKNAVF